MALDDIPQLDEIDEVLDDLSSPTSLEVYEAMLPYDDSMVSAAAAQRAVNGGGGGGGSLPVTDSWLVATDTLPQTVDGLIPWTLTGSDGADIAINGSDSALIDILTTGIYVIMFSARFQGDPTGAGNIQVTFFGDFTGFMEPGGVSASSPPIVPPSFSSSYVFTSPPIPITAPLQVAINAGINTTAEEISVEGVITIVRIF